MMRRILAQTFYVLTLCMPAVAGEFDPIRGVSPDKPVPMMINLSELADWGTQQPFIDRMKVARPWIGHLPGQWGGLDQDDLTDMGVLDAAGWPKRLPSELGSIGTLVMTDLPEEAVSLSGRYVLRFDGTGIVEVGGRASNVRYGENQVTFDFNPGGGGVDIRIQRTDRMGEGDYVRNITVMRQDRVGLYDAGAVFNPDFVDVISGFDGLRFMSWMQTNGSDIGRWEDRPLPGDYSYMWRGIPIELMMTLTRQVGAEVWLTLPHKADDYYFRKAAEQVKSLLDPSQRVYVEYSNEVWNRGFEQAIWADEQAKARWGVDDQRMQFYGMRAAEMAMIWRDVFADQPDRLVTVFATQAGWLGLEQQALDAPLWRAEDPQNPAPHSLFDAYAITGYFNAKLGYPEKHSIVHGWLDDSIAQAEAAGRDKGLAGGALQDYVQAHRYDHAVALAGSELLEGRITGIIDGTVKNLTDTVFPHHRAVAQRHGMELIMYEGGTHVVGVGPVIDDAELDAFFRVLNYSDEMAILYSHLLSSWSQVTDGYFNVYEDVTRLSKWGSWGLLRYLSDTNPRWDTVLQFRDARDG